MFVHCLCVYHGKSKTWETTSQQKGTLCLTIKIFLCRCYAFAIFNFKVFFIPTPVTNEKQIQLQLLRDFENFARRMRLRYISHGQDKEPQPFHVKSTWKPPIQRSVALESYLEEVKIQLAEIKPTKPKHNLPAAEQKALKALKHDKEINLKKADKGTTTVLFSIQDKIKEGKIQLDNKEHYRPLEEPMGEETNRRVIQLVNELYHKNHIDETTKKWLCERSNPP